MAWFLRSSRHSWRGNGARFSLFYPSCQQKRVRLFAERLDTHILEQGSHARWVFTVPKLLRPIFKLNRRELGLLCTSAWQALREMFQEVASDPSALPGVVISVQNYGDRLNIHPHERSPDTKICSPDFLVWIHGEFYERMPDEFHSHRCCSAPTRKKRTAIFLSCSGIDLMCRRFGSHYTYLMIHPRMYF